MVGDSGSDIRAAALAGVGSIAVTWGWQEEALLRAAQPTRLVQSVEELRHCLLGLQGPF
jgi:phosphoglycolate phosphatase-like HAD superfamily hydrolase